MSLLERLEAATGPDRELDRDIADAIGLGPPDDWERKPRNLPGGGVYLDCGSWISPNGGLMRHSKPYTASIDAALTLVPEGWAFTVARYWCEGEDRPPFFADCADLQNLIADEDCEIFQAWGATPALAICVVALKAVQKRSNTI